MNENKTSEEWQKIHSDIIVLDPDGWDRSDSKSWYQEEISEEEYFRRRDNSTQRLATREEIFVNVVKKVIPESEYVGLNSWSPISVQLDGYFTEEQLEIILTALKDYNRKG